MPEAEAILPPPVPDHLFETLPDPNTIKTEIKQLTRSIISRISFLIGYTGSSFLLGLGFTSIHINRAKQLIQEEEYNEIISPEVFLISLIFSTITLASLLRQTKYLKEEHERLLYLKIRTNRTY